MTMFLTMDVILAINYEFKCGRYDTMNIFFFKNEKGEWCLRDDVIIMCSHEQVKHVKKF